MKKRLLFYENSPVIILILLRRVSVSLVLSVTCINDKRIWDVILGMIRLKTLAGLSCFANTHLVCMAPIDL